MYNEINRSIRVGVKFSTGEIKPVWFVWEDRLHQIDEVHFYHRSFEGEAPIHHFAVSAQRTVYHLIFDGKKLNWKLKRVWVE